VDYLIHIEEHLLAVCFNHTQAKGRERERERDSRPTYSEPRTPEDRHGHIINMILIEHHKNKTFLPQKQQLRRPVTIECPCSTAVRYSNTLADRKTRDV